MDNSTGISKLSGRLGSVLLALGVVSYFVGIFGGPRVLAFVGLGMMIVSLVAFFVEEKGQQH